ncbi:MAG: hypothetical protein K9J13_08595 [Saprospiraceae bacterium]|nr:hypothetical protein [Saprospiraceae bacterium]
MLSSEKKSQQNLRFGIMCSGYEFQSWQAESIKILLENGQECALLIIDDNSIEEKSLFSKSARFLGKNALFNFYQRFFLRPSAKEIKSLSFELKDIPIIKCKTEKKKFSQYFSDDDISKIKEYKLDFIIRYGFSIIKGEILNSAKYGVWSFHHDDEQIYRGVPSGFWEIMEKDAANGAILQRLTNRLDGGVILKKGWFKTVSHSFKGNIDSTLNSTIDWPWQIANQIIQCGEDSHPTKESSSSAKIRFLPRNFLMLKFFTKLFCNKIKFHYQELFCPEDWALGIIKKDIKSLIENGIQEKQIHWIKSNEPNKYFADGFVFEDDNKLQVFCENYDYKTEPANLMWLILDKESFKIIEKKVVLDNKSHLSFPYVFKNDKNIYCLPEASASGKLELYIWNDKNKTLDFSKTLLPDFAAVDPAIFNHNNKWWIFANEKYNSNTLLNIFYSENLEGPYLPHILNPVKTDICSSRSAGQIIKNEKGIFRPAQDSASTYGSQIVINKIIKLNEHEFEEQAISFLSPKNLKNYRKGLHTLSFTDNYVLIDAKRFKFNWHYFIRQIRRKMKRLF